MESTKIRSIIAEEKETSEDTGLYTVTVKDEDGDETRFPIIKTFIMPYSKNCTSIIKDRLKSSIKYNIKRIISYKEEE